MKLNKEIKKRIDNFFNNISEEELYDIAVHKYGFTENNEIEIEDESFVVIQQSYYYSNADNSIDVDEQKTLPLAA